MRWFDAAFRLIRQLFIRHNSGLVEIDWRRNGERAAALEAAAAPNVCGETAATVL
jgi:hypothetical protein